MVEKRKIWQIGLVVADMEAARCELREVLGLEFPVPRSRRFGDYEIKVSIAPTGPPYFELIEGEPGGPWDGRTGSRLDHLSYWVENLRLERERLLAEGCPVFIDGAKLGLHASYHVLPHTNVRVEPVTSSYKDQVRGSWGIDDVDSVWNPRAPWQLGFMVDEIEAARDEFSRVLGVEWTPVKARGKGGDLSVCMTTDGPPYLELVHAGEDADLAWRPSPRFDHLAYWAEDLMAESSRLDRLGAPFVQEIRPEIRFHHAPKSGIRMEVMAGSYRDAVRLGWGVEDVG